MYNNDLHPMYDKQKTGKGKNKTQFQIKFSNEKKTQKFKIKEKIKILHTQKLGIESAKLGIILQVSGTE